MDSEDEHIDSVDLQIQTVQNREKYTVAIQKIHQKCSRLRIKTLETESKIEEPKENIRLPELNVHINNIELDILNKQLITDVKNDIKEQIRTLMILKKKMDCPISQRMDEL